MLYSIEISADHDVPFEEAEKYVAGVADKVRELVAGLDGVTHASVTAQQVGVFNLLEK